MSIKLDLELALKDALRSKDNIAKTTIRMSLSAIKFSEIEERKQMDDTRIIAILHKEVKNRQEAINDAKTANREDLVISNMAEIQVLERFLPKQLTEDEIRDMAEKTIAELNANNLSDMGNVMKIILPLVEGRAPGSKISQIVRELLQN